MYKYELPGSGERTHHSFRTKISYEHSGFGWQKVRQLMDAHIITSISSIFELKKDDVISLERFGEKSAQNLIDEIEKVNHKPCPDFSLHLAYLM